MIEIYQDSWFDIPFKSFCTPDRKHIADEEFYEKFYGEFYKKFQGYQSLPEHYRRSKLRVVNKILTSDNIDSILSIGSGNGFIEDQLSRSIGEVIAVEPSVLASRWLAGNNKVKCYSGYFPEALPTQLKSRLTKAYSVGVDYIFNNEAYVEFLKSIIDFGITDYSMYQATLYSRHSAPKLFIRMLLIRYGFYRSSEYQLWGRSRSRNETEACFLKAGFDLVHVGRLEDGTWWVNGKVGNH